MRTLRHILLPNLRPILLAMLPVLVVLPMLLCAGCAQRHDASLQNDEQTMTTDPDLARSILETIDSTQFTSPVDWHLLTLLHARAAQQGAPTVTEASLQAKLVEATEYYRAEASRAEQMTIILAVALLCITAAAASALIICRRRLRRASTVGAVSPASAIPDSNSTDTVISEAAITEADAPKECEFQKELLDILGIGTASINQICRVAATDDPEVTAFIRKRNFPAKRDSFRRVVNLSRDNLIDRFREDYQKLTEKQHDLFLYRAMGLGARAISIIFDMSQPNFYAMRRKLNTVLQSSPTARTPEYLKILDKS